MMDFNCEFIVSLLRLPCSVICSGLLYKLNIPDIIMDNKAQNAIIFSTRVRELNSVKQKQ